MISHNSHVAQYCIKSSRDRQAGYTATAALKPVGLDDKSVVLDSAVQRIYRMKKGILTSSRLIGQRLENDLDHKGRKIAWTQVMVTLTYADHINYSPDHISTFLDCVSVWGRRAGYKLPYCWVMELTKKGKPHYHCIIWIPKRLRLPRADSRGWWKHGCTNTKRAFNAYGYLAKYASKASGVRDDNGVLLQFPKGARIHGIGGLTKHEAAVIAWWKLPKALRLGEEGSHKWRRRVGGGWRCIAGLAAGEEVESEWGLAAINVPGKRVRLLEKKPVVHVDRPDITSAYVEWVVEQSIALSRIYSESRRQGINRVSWNDSGRATVTVIPFFESSPEGLSLASPLGLFQLEPIPF